MIYSFALTTDEPVICVPYQKDGQLKQRLQIRQDNNKPTKDLNQMKFVCHQLYEETSTLGPGRSGELIFPLRKDTKEAASVTCAQFLDEASPAFKSSLREITIHERIPYRARRFWTMVFDLGGVARLLAFCRAHPNVTIRVHPNCFNLPDRGYGHWLLSDLVEFAVRKQVDITSSDLRYLKVAIDRMARADPAFGEDAPAFPDNLQFICGIH